MRLVNHCYKESVTLNAIILIKFITSEMRSENFIVFRKSKRDAEKIALQQTKKSVPK